MRTYRIKVDGKVYEMEISLKGEEVYMPSESGFALGERLQYSLRTEMPPKKAEKEN